MAKQKDHLFNPLEDHHIMYDHATRDYVEVNKPEKTKTHKPSAEEKEPAAKPAAVPKRKVGRKPAAKGVFKPIDTNNKHHGSEKKD